MPPQRKTGRGLLPAGMGSLSHGEGMAIGCERLAWSLTGGSMMELTELLPLASNPNRYLKSSPAAV